MHVSPGQAPTARRPTEADTEPGSAAGPLSPGELLGRYVVLEQVGEGGMGTVYAAYDPVLERKIALKLLHVGGADSTEAQAQRSLLVREAQAMARLAHPNVVTVHDVGQHGDEVFIAMEFVAGGTLAAAFATPGLLPADILDLFLGAGRGLEAAHRAGIVHRDFKPENVLVAEDGRALVTDFGIARLGAAGSAEVVESRREQTDAGDNTASATGRRPGTPAYMSPEQHLGRPGDARSDQFAFAVALWEGLYGERPYHGATVAALAVAVTHGRITEPPHSDRVSPQLRQCLDRALACDPAERFDSMAALLESLTPKRGPLRRWVLPAAFGTVAIGALGWAASGNGTPEPCTGAAAAVRVVWGSPEREALRRSWRSHSEFAENTAERVISALDDYGTAWALAHRETCEATRVRGERSEQLLDLGMACLLAKRASLGAAAELLSAPDDGVVRRGLDIAGGLPALGPCADVQAMSRLDAPPSDPESQDTIAALHASLGRSSALLNAGKYPEALQVAAAAAELAEALDYPPMRAEVLVRLGVAQTVTGDPAAAHATHIEAYFLAASDRAELMATRAAGEIMYGLANKGEYEASMTWYRHADASLSRIGRSATDDARLSNGLGVLLHGKGEFADAVVAYQRALELQDDPKGVGAGNAINDLALAYEKQGDYEKAVELHSKAMALREALGGKDHPDVADSHNNIGLALHNLGDLEGAREHYERAVEIYTVALGPNNLGASSALNNLGGTLNDLGEREAASEALKRSLAIRSAKLEPDDPLIASVYKSLGRGASRSRNYALAQEHFIRALEIYEPKLGAQHPFVGEVLYLLAEAKRNLGAYEEAETYYVRALEVFNKAFPNGHPFIGIVTRDHARLALAQDRVVVGRERAERAVALIAESLGESHNEMAMARTTLARALLAEGSFEASAKEWALAVEIREGDVSCEDVPLIYGYIGLAKANVELKNARAAAEAIDKGSALSLAHLDREDIVGALAFARAKLARLGSDAAAARTHLAHAVTAYEKAGPDYASELADVLAWR